MRQSESLLQFKPSSNFKEGEGAGWGGTEQKTQHKGNHPLAGEEAS